MSNSVTGSVATAPQTQTHDSSSVTDESALSVQNLSHLIKEWMRVTQELDSYSAEIRSRRRKQKELRTMILNIMHGNSLAVLNVSAGHIVREEKSSKSNISKKYLGTTLVEFFKGDKDQAMACVEWIESHRPLRVSEKLSIQPRVGGTGTSIISGTGSQ